MNVETPKGPAAVHFRGVERPRAALVLGHGAGGGVGAPDLVAAADAAVESSVTVALVEQPYRVAGRRSPPPAATLDVAWTAVVERLREDELRGLPLIVGGRSLGGRVACRTSAAVGAAAVICLAFPLQPPQRRSGAPASSRLEELDGVAVPTLVVQGARDPFGVPPPGPRRAVVEVPGDHGLRAGVDDVREAVRSWLPSVLDGAAERRILEAIRAIPEGFVRTYGDLSPGAPRLAGRVLRTTNEDVPWWRVVRADGSLAVGDAQRARLEAEGVPFRRGRVDLRVVRMFGDGVTIEGR